MPGFDQIVNVALKMRENTVAICNQNTILETEKVALIPPFFTSENKGQILVIKEFLQKEMQHYSTVAQMIYTLRSRHNLFFAYMDKNNSNQYAPLKFISDQLPVFQRTCEEISLEIFDQIRFLETSNFSQFTVSWFRQQKIMTDAENFAEKYSKFISLRDEVADESVVVDSENKFVSCKTYFNKTRGFAKLAAMIVLAFTAFVQSIMPVAYAGQSPTRPMQGIVQAATPSRASPQVVFKMPNITQAVKSVTAQILISVEQCVDFIKYWEGFRSASYRDKQGYWTIGFGTCIDTKIRPDAPQIMARYGYDYAQILAGKKRIDKVEAQKIMTPDVYSAYNVAPRAVRSFSQLKPEAQMIVVDMIYNLGVKNFLGFKKMINALNNLDYETAAVEMKNSKWYTQTAKRAKHHVEDMRAIAAMQQNGGTKLAA